MYDMTAMILMILMINAIIYCNDIMNGTIAGVQWVSGDLSHNQDVGRNVTTCVTKTCSHSKWYPVMMFVG